MLLLTLACQQMQRRDRQMSEHRCAHDSFGVAEMHDGMTQTVCISLFDAHSWSQCFTVAVSVDDALIEERFPRLPFESFAMEPILSEK